MKLLGFVLLPLLCAGSGFDVYIGDCYPHRTTAMVTDSAGDTYFTGGRVIGNLLDIFVTKLDGSGSVIFTVTIGGKGSDVATSIAVDRGGNIWIGGHTTSPDFPLLNSIQSQPGAVGTTGFVMEFAPDGSPIFSTYFGGIVGSSSVNAVSVDAEGNGYVTGETLSTDYPVTAGMPTAGVGNGVGSTSGAFVAKISASGGSNATGALSGRKIIYSGLLAGTSAACEEGSLCFVSTKQSFGTAIAVDAAGDAYFAGNTTGTNLVPPGLATLNATGLGAFAGKVKADGSGLAYLSYLTTVPQIAFFSPVAFDPLTLASGIAVDSSGALYVTGHTADASFPATPSAYQTSFASPPSTNLYTPAPADAFVAKLAPDGTALVWATYLGGAGYDAANSIALDSNDNVWLSGITGSPTFPNGSGWAEGGDFVVGLNSSGSVLTFSARYPNSTVSTAVAVDPAGLIHAAGLDGMGSAFLPSLQPATEIQGIANAAAGYVTGRIVPGEVISIYGANIGPSTPVSAIPSNGLVPTTLGGVQVTIGGYAAPLLYVSQRQINAVVPFELSGSSNTVEISFGSTAIPAFTTVTSPGEPGVFTALNGVGVFDSNSSFAPGSIASMWVTGLNLGAFGVTDGQIATTAQEAAPPLQVLVESNGLTPAGTLVPASIVYEGLAPGLIEGVTQINFQIPSTGFGPVTVVDTGHNSPVAHN